MQINAQGQLKIQDFKENENPQAFIKKANENQEEEFNSNQFYEY